MDKEEFFSSVLPVAAAIVSDRRENDPCTCLAALTDEEIRSIYFYTTEHDNFSYKSINSLLCDSVSGVAGLEHQIDAIDTALFKLPGHVGNCMRGEEFGGRVHGKAELVLQKGSASSVSLTPEDLECVYADFFMSVTLKAGSAHLEKPVKVLILSKGGAKGIYHISAFADEVELLYARNSRFLLVEIDYDDAGKVSTISLAEV